jgi:hypothetical protein
MAERAQITIGATDATGPAFASVQGKLAALGDKAKNIGSQFSALTAGLGGLGGAAGLAAFAAFVQRTVQSLDALNDAADATGAAIEKLGGLEDVAVRTGTGFDVVTGALVKLNQALNGATAGSATERTLQAIGLSAAALRDQDPADALLEIAQALSRYADDGNKARAVQELFGRSVREVAPLLKDLADNGVVAAQGLAEQAAAAEQYNRNLAALSKNATDFSRAIVGQVVPALNSLADKARGQPFGAGLVEFFRSFGREFSANLNSDELNRVVGQIEVLQRQLNSETDPRLQSRTSKRIEELRERARELQGQLLRTTDALKGFSAVTAPLPIERDGSDNRFFRSRPSVIVPDAPKAPRKAERPTVGRSDIIDLGSFDDLEAVRLADARDRLRETEAVAAEARRFFEQTRTPAEALSAAIARQGELLAQLGPAYAATYARAVTAAGEAFREQTKVTEAVEKLSEFAVQAQRNIQDALGDTLFRTLSGKFDDIGRAWGDLMLRLAAQAAAAKLGEALFGANGSGGALSNVLRTLFPARAFGGSVEAGRPYLVGEHGPELFMPRASGSIIPSAAGGPSFTQVVNISAGVSRSEVVAAMQTATLQAEARITEAMRRGRLA